MALRLRDLWVGWHRPSFDGDLPTLEPWSVWLVQIQTGPAFQFKCFGKLLKAPWTKVGGGGSHRPGAPCPEAREWLRERGRLEPAVWVPVGSLLQPANATIADLKPWRPGPTRWTPTVWHDSLASARQAGLRMADVLCPRDQVRRSFNAARP